MTDAALAEAVVADPPVATTGSGMAIEIRNVSHHFSLSGAQLPVLEAIDFSVAPGDFVALLGPSAAENRPCCG